MYLAVKGHAILMNAKEDPYIIICADEQEYSSKDKGGAIYTVPAVTFEVTPQAGLEDSEQVSKTPVKPLKKAEYQSSIDALREMNAKIYFVNEKEFNGLLKAKDEKKQLASLRPAAA